MNLVLMIIFTMKVTYLDYLILMFVSLLDIRKRNKRSHGKRKNGNLKRKNKHVLALSHLSITLKHSGRHMTLSRLVTLSISSPRNLDTEANKFYDRVHRLYDAALTSCYPVLHSTCSLAIYRLQN